jgi:hypothetical protein
VHRGRAGDGCDLRRCLIAVRYSPGGSGGASNGAQAEAALAAARHARRATVDLASAHDLELFGAERFTARVRALVPILSLPMRAERAAVP